jgi:hypothetical protein
MAWKPAQFIAVDGEAVTLGFAHTYVQLCASTGDYVENPAGLTSVQCFEFLLNLKRKYPRHTLVGFSFNYDVNMMLGDVPKVQLEDLWRYRESTAVLGDTIYELSWLPNKVFTVRSDISVKVSDVFGFFQTSFLKALELWKIGDKEELELIEAGKASRSVFKLEDLTEMRRYCLLECTLLVELMDSLQDSMLAADLHLTSWHGAGAVAAAMLKKYKVKEHRTPDEYLPDGVQDAVMHAYYGGRFQLLQQGRFSEVYNYDIKSAYPHEAITLPALHGTWSAERYYTPSPYAIWLCEWELPTSRYVMPFPYRTKQGEIYYPSYGQGWYYAQEVEAALKHHPEIKVKRGYVFTPDYTKQPFWFIDLLYQKRKVAQANNDPAEKAYKLGLNSLYGKLAQGAGYHGSIPPYRSFVWAGMITSNTRARLLEYSLGNEEAVIAYATDGLFFDRDVGLPTGSELGELELSVVQDYYMLANGIYFGAEDTIVNKVRTRGHHAKELDLDTLRQGWEDEGPGFIHAYQSTRFIGLGVALMLKDFSLWRTWSEARRTLQLNQTYTLKYNLQNPDQLVIPGIDVTKDELGDTVRWYSNSVSHGLSKEYSPKTDAYSYQTREQRDSVLSLLTGFDQPDYGG